MLRYLIGLFKPAVERALKLRVFRWYLFGVLLSAVLLTGGLAACSWSSGEQAADDLRVPGPAAPAGALKSETAAPVSVEEPDDEEALEPDAIAAAILNETEPAPPATAPADTVLTITGDGVAAAQYFRWTDLQRQPLLHYLYSTVNTWPRKMVQTVEGIDLGVLLASVGLSDSATLITIYATDGFSQSFTVAELLGATRYAFPHIQEDSAEAQNEVPVLLSRQQDDTLLLCVGQRTLQEQNELWWVQKVNTIEVSTEVLSRWTAPEADVTPGTVTAGTAVRLQHEQLDAVKVYYTLDGSEPGIHSSLYNVSRTFFQPQLNGPIVIEADTTIRAVTVGNGRLDSETVEFKYEVDATL